MNYYKFTLLNQWTSDDSTLIVMQVRAEWVHGTYGTHEQATFIYTISAGNPAQVAWSNGVLDVEGVTRANGSRFWSELNAASL